MYQKAVDINYFIVVAGGGGGEALASKTLAAAEAAAAAAETGALVAAPAHAWPSLSDYRLVIFTIQALQHCHR